MRQHRGHWNRGTWTRKPNPLEGVESPPSSNFFSVRNGVKDDSWNWTDTGRSENCGAFWDAQTIDPSFFDENQKIFEWDDSGALEVLKKAEAKLQQGLGSSYADYQQYSEQVLAPIDWDTRWSCNLPDCAEVFSAGDDKKKTLKGSSNFARKEQSCSTSPIILGLPGAKDDDLPGATPSLYLPLDFVPVPTGWDEAEENPAVLKWEDAPKQSESGTNFGKSHIEHPSHSYWQSPVNPVGVTAAELPEYPSSYKHIIPSGWGDVQTDPPVVPSSGWGNINEDSRSDVLMYQADYGWGDCPPQDPIISGSGWDNFYSCVEPCEERGNSHPGKLQEFYNNSYKYGYWKPKRGCDLNKYESSGRRTMQRPGRPNSTRPGRPISAMYKVNHDPRPPRVNRWDRSKSQWQSVGVLTHGTETVSGSNLPGRTSFLDQDCPEFENNHR